MDFGSMFLKELTPGVPTSRFSSWSNSFNGRSLGSLSARFLQCVGSQSTHFRLFVFQRFDQSWDRSGRFFTRAGELNRRVTAGAFVELFKALICLDTSTSWLQNPLMNIRETSNTQSIKSCDG